MVYNGDVELIMKRIKHVMIDSDIRQSDIVEKTGLTKGAISNLLGGKSKNVTLDTLLMLCRAIDCNLIIDVMPTDEHAGNQR